MAEKKQCPRCGGWAEYIIHDEITCTACEYVKGYVIAEKSEHERKKEEVHREAVEKEQDIGRGRQRRSEKSDLSASEVASKLLDEVLGKKRRRVE